MKLSFWGTRGSIAVPGPDTLRYGGNTTCLCLEIEGQPPLILDAGTGIRALGLRLAQGGPRRINLLVTHLHWDHLLGFLFFEPAYRQGYEVAVGGWPRAMEGLTGLFDSRRGDGYFPVMFSDLPSKVRADEILVAPRINLGPLEVRTIPLNHPQGGIGLKFQMAGRSLVFLTDNELHGPGRLGLEDYARFCQGAQVLVHDAQYLPQERRERQGWGHSDWESVVELAQRAGVEHLVLTHHDPGRTDREVEAILAQARDKAGRGLRVDAAQEGMEIALAGQPGPTAQGR
jgi:phosphoribosyl 1,2-cyclic phosphodiesterase